MMIENEYVATRKIAKTTPLELRSNNFTFVDIWWVGFLSRFVSLFLVAGWGGCFLASCLFLFGRCLACWSFASSGRFLFGSFGRHGEERWLRVVFRGTDDNARTEVCINVTAEDSFFEILINEECRRCGVGRRVIVIVGQRQSWSAWRVKLRELQARIARETG